MCIKRKEYAKNLHAKKFVGVKVSWEMVSTKIFVKMLTWFVTATKGRLLPKIPELQFSFFFFFFSFLLIRELLISNIF